MARRSLGAQIVDRGRKTGDRVVAKVDVLCFGTQTNADALGWLPGIADFVVLDRDIFGFARNINRDAAASAAVDYAIVLKDISVRPKIFAPTVVSKKNTADAAAKYFVASNDVVGIVVPNGHAVLHTVEYTVILGQPKLDSPAPKNADAVLLNLIVANERALGTAAGVQSQIGIIDAMATLDHDIVANLPTNAIAVVVAYGKVAHRDAAAILQPDAAAVVAVEIVVVGSVSVEG